jgi:hypothetical protein
MSTPSSDSEIGFSTRTGTPAATSSPAMPRWNFGGVATIAASGFQASAAATSGNTLAFVVAATASARAIRIDHGNVRTRRGIARVARADRAAAGDQDFESHCVK